MTGIFHLPRSSPEAQGISSAAITILWPLLRIRSTACTAHALRQGNVVAEVGGTPGGLKHLTSILAQQELHIHCQWDWRS